jgi:Ca2+-binding RTX toxin-like protein
MTVVIDFDTDTYTNYANLTGSPALRISANDVIFTNFYYGQITAATKQDSAIVNTGNRNIIYNLEDAVISSASGTFDAETAPTILGGSFDDAIDNAGTILGIIDFGNGNDVYLDRSLSTLAQLPWVKGGAGNDTYIIVPKTAFARSARFDGGTGTDTLYINGLGGDTSSFILTSVENVIIANNGVVETINGVSSIVFDMRYDSSWSSLRFSTSPDADVTVQQIRFEAINTISIYDRSAIKSFVGSDYVEHVALGNDTLVSGVIDLAAGNDELTIVRSQFSNAEQEQLGSAVLGGPGVDALKFTMSGGLFDAGNVVDFEAMRFYGGEAMDPETTVRNARGFTTVDVYTNANARLDAADLAGATITMDGGSRLAIGATSKVGAITVRNFGPANIVNTALSVDIVVEGQVLGTVQTSVGNDRVSAAGSASALNANGGAGDDVLTGGDAADRLDGGLGTDMMYGGKGDDTYVVDSTSDLFFENFGEGVDTVETTVSLYLFANVEALRMSGSAPIFGVGNGLSNLLRGNDADNLLLGGAGDDVLIGRGGNDSLFGEGEDDTLSGGDGIDYLVGGTGNDWLLGLADADALYGEDGDDLLDGGDTFHTDILVGGAGNDTLDGASGLGDYDLMDGGAGDDIYFVDTPNDLTFEAAGGGIDTVRANINGAGYYLYAHTENLILEGNTPFGVGNELANQLTGNAIGNYLLGGLGTDTLNGKAGNDVLFGEGGADTFVFERGTGGDVIGDFAPGTDKISLIGLGFANYAALQPNIFQVGGNTGINLGQGDFIVLNGVTNAQLSAADFLFG